MLQNFFTGDSHSAFTEPAEQMWKEELVRVSMFELATQPLCLSSSSVMESL